MTQLYIDSDGVFADFDTQLFNMHGVRPGEIDDGEMWKLIHADFRFWTEMPLMKDAMVLWDAVKHVNPIVLTGCHRDNFDDIAAEKVVFWRERFNHDRVITCLSKNKAFHMESPGDVLVDDMSKNIKKWVKAGGVGVLHRNAADTIQQLKTLGVI